MHFFGLFSTISKLNFKFRSFLINSITIPGKPAPDPISKIFLSFASIYLINWAESSICLLIMLTSEFFDIKLSFLLYFIKKSQYLLIFSSVSRETILFK